MESTLLVFGLNHRTAPVAVRERFWISESGLYKTLHCLRNSLGVEEAVVLATCNRTEFILWTNDFGPACVLSILERDYAFATEDRKYFYRLLGDDALVHVFRVAAGLDSMVLGEPEITGQVKSAWTKARQAGASGRFLDAVLQKALSVSKRVRNETKIGALAVSVPSAAVELAQHVLGSLQGRKVLILGAGKMGELSARYMLAKGAGAVWVMNRTYEHAVELARTLGGTAVSFEERWRYWAEADIVIFSTGCPHFILTCEDAQRICEARAGRHLVLIDIAVPRDVAPAVREVPGLSLHDIDDLGAQAARNQAARQDAAAIAGIIVAHEALDFRRELDAERVVPTIVAFRDRLEDIGRQQLEQCVSEFGPLTPNEQKTLEAFKSRLICRIAGVLACELKGIEERHEQDQLTAAAQQLFQLGASFGSKKFESRSSADDNLRGSPA
jgi:glutamyl-tRNA reductase